MIMAKPPSHSAHLCFPILKEHAKPSPSVSQPETVDKCVSLTPSSASDKTAAETRQPLFSDFFWGGKKPHSWALTPQIHLPPEAIFYCGLCTHEQWPAIVTVTHGQLSAVFPTSRGNLSWTPNNHLPGRKKDTQLLSKMLLETAFFFFFFFNRTRGQ